MKRKDKDSNPLWQNDFTTLLLRLLAVYVIMAILQVAFYMIDKPYLGHISDFSETLSIAKGALRFNLMSVLLANTPFILLSILPFHFRERRWYQGILYAIYLITNSAVIILNSADIIYFTHTMKRVTFEDTHFTSNSNNLPIILDFITHNLPVIIIALALIGLLIYSWHYIIYRPTRIENKRRYYLINSIVALIVVVLTICGIRGTSMTSTAVASTWVSATLWCLSWRVSARNTQNTSVPNCIATKQAAPPSSTR